MLASIYSQMALTQDARANARAAMNRLQEAVQLHNAIQRDGVFLRDSTNVYQENWRLALEGLLRERAADFDFLELLG
jgi:hypothetical protein